MNRPQLLLVAAGVLAALIVAACSTTSASSSSSGNTPSDDSGTTPTIDGATTTPDAQSANPDSGKGVDAAVDATITDSGVGCTFVNLSGSSGSSGACSTTETYSCNGNTVDITCDCPSAKCTCTGGGSFAANCKTCGLSDPKDRLKCGVDTEPPTSDGGGSSSSSSGK